MQIIFNDTEDILEQGKYTVYYKNGRCHLNEVNKSKKEVFLYSKPFKFYNSVVIFQQYILYII